MRLRNFSLEHNSDVQGHFHKIPDGRRKKNMHNFENENNTVCVNTNCNRDNLNYLSCGALCIVFSSLYVCFIACCVCFVCFYPCKTEQEVRVRIGHFTAPSGTSSPFCRRWGGRRWPPQTCHQRYGPSAAAGPLWSHWSCCILRRPAGTQWVWERGVLYCRCEKLLSKTFLALRLCVWCVEVKGCWHDNVAFSTRNVNHYLINSRLNEFGN